MNLRKTGRARSERSSSVGSTARISGHTLPLGVPRFSGGAVFLPPSLPTAVNDRVARQKGGTPSRERWVDLRAEFRAGSQSPFSSIVPRSDREPL